MSESMPSQTQHHDAAKLSWEDTAREMAAADESWWEWEALGGDGLASLPREPHALQYGRTHDRHRE